ncbi:hypothetical protein [Nostoc sp.]
MCKTPTQYSFQLKLTLMGTAVPLRVYLTAHQNQAKCYVELFVVRSLALY